LQPHVIGSRPIAALLASQAISGLGSQMTFLALPWFVLVTSGSPSRMGLVFAVEVLPVALFGIPSGGVVQRYGARSTMLVCDFASAPLIALIPLLHALGALPFPLLLGIVFATGVFLTPYFSASRLLLPEILGEDERAVAQGNTVLEGTTQLTGLIGPAVAGVLIGVLGAANVLWLDAASFLASFALLAALVPAGSPVVPEEHERGLLAGVRYIARDRLLRLVTFVSLLVGVVIPFLFAAVPVLAYERYDGRAEVAGWMFAAWGGGSVAGSAFAYRAVARLRPLRLARVAFVACALPLWGLLFELPPVGPVAAIFACSFFVPSLNAPVLGLFSLRVPRALRGKTMTALVTANSLARPVSYAVAGPLLAHAGLGPTFLVVAVGMSLAAAVFVAGTLNAGEAAVEEAA
jgi:MFS family permease